MSLTLPASCLLSTFGVNLVVVAAFREVQNKQRIPVRHTFKSFSEDDGSNLNDDLGRSKVLVLVFKDCNKGSFLINVV